MKLLVTSKIEKTIYDQLEEMFDIDYHDSNTSLSKEEYKKRIANVDALLCPLSDKVDAEIIDAGENLKIIANYGAGYDNIDIKKAQSENIIVTNAPAPSSAVSTAELTLGLIIASARKFIQGERDLRSGGFKGWKPSYFLGSQLKDKRLGIIGMGNIGKNVAKRALAFEMDVVYHSRNKKYDMEEMGIEYLELDDLIKTSDFISIHTAYANDLHHMISSEEFAMMKNSAILINAARGPLVDEKALVSALKNKEIAGAGLDVYEFEPQVAPELLEQDNVSLLPHLGNATYEARLEMGQNAIDNLKDFIEGKTPRNKVN